MFDFFETLSFGREVIDPQGERWLSLKCYRDDFHLCIKLTAEFPASTFLVAIDKEATKKFEAEKIKEFKELKEKEEKETKETEAKNEKH